MRLSRRGILFLSSNTIWMLLSVLTLSSTWVLMQANAVGILLLQEHRKKLLRILVLTPVDFSNDTFKGSIYKIDVIIEQDDFRDYKIIFIYYSSKI